MTTTVERFGYDAECGRPVVAVEMSPTRTPFDDLDLRFEAIGSEYDDVDSLFGVYNGDERIYRLRHLMGAVMFVDALIGAMTYTLIVRHGPGLESTRVIEIDERKVKRLADVRYHLRESLR